MKWPEVLAFLCPQASSQSEELHTIIQNRQWDEEVSHAWHYSWGSTTYNTKKAYSMMLGVLETSPLFPWLWSSSNLGKHKFFVYVLIKDMLNTRNLLRRKNKTPNDYSCVLYNIGCEETSFHLFFEYSFSQSCWNTIPIQWDLSLPPPRHDDWSQDKFGNLIFKEIVITSCWVIWTTRNGIIFNNGSCNLNASKAHAKEKLGWVCIKAKPSRKGSLDWWREITTLSHTFLLLFVGPRCLVPLLCCTFVNFSPLL